MLDVARHFPALGHTVNGKRLAFLDSAASAQKPHVVLDAMTAVLSGPYANIHRGLYFNSAETTAAFEASRATLADFLKVDAPSLIFTRNATESVNLVAQTWGRKNLTATSVVVLTEIEHHANIVPWQLLQAEKGFTIRVIPLAVLQNLTAETVTPYLEGATLLAVTQMSNVSGFRPDLATLIPLAKAAGSTVLVDGSQAVVHGPQNVAELGADFYVCTGHKIYGPNGIGLLWGRAEVLAGMPPYQGGGDMIETVTLPVGTTFAAAPARFEAGTPAIAEAIGLAAAVHFLQGLGWEKIAAHEARLAGYLTSHLEALPFIELYSPRGSGIAAFNIKGAHHSDVATLLDQQGVAVRSGHHCAMPYMKALGIEGCVRASLGVYSGDEDIAQLVAGLEKAHAMLV